MVDLVNNVVGQITGQGELGVTEQAHLNEIAVPAVHFVEAPAGNDPWQWQIEKAVLADGRGIGRQSKETNFFEVRRWHFGTKRGLHVAEIFVSRDIDRQGAARGSREFGINGGQRQAAVSAG
jgi:hypothetical protein